VAEYLHLFWMQLGPGVGHHLPQLEIGVQSPDWICGSLHVYSGEVHLLVVAARRLASEFNSR
jgi:hypothetical protein